MILTNDICFCDAISCHREGAGDSSRADRRLLLPPRCEEATSAAPKGAARRAGVGPPPCASSRVGVKVARRRLLFVAATGNRTVIPNSCGRPGCNGETPKPGHGASKYYSFPTNYASKCKFDVRIISFLREQN